MKVINIPTGKIIISDYSKGQLETLSIGDYGKENNIKADFLGFNKEINGVANTNCKNLSEKWVVTLSTQYGCSMSCIFCDCPQIRFNGNATVDDLKVQLLNALNEYKEVRYTDRLNIHFARMGEPSFNYKNVFKFSSWLSNKPMFQEETNIRVETIHPVFTTMVPKNHKRISNVLSTWCNIKNMLFNGQAGLQLSINSTDVDQRDTMFNKMSLSLGDISKIAKTLPTSVGRKYCLNFAITDNTIIDPEYLSSLFDINNWMVKITPIHNNNACRNNKIETKDGYSSYSVYKEHEDNLKSFGFDVLVFVPSEDEERTTVTCGNAILGGSTIR